MSLEQLGVSVWFDEFSLKVGDSLRQAIDRGLKHSSYGIVVFSKAFFSKAWTQYELDGLIERELQGGKVLLPVWHGVGHSDLLGFSPSLAGRFAFRSDEGVIRVAEKLQAFLEEKNGRAPLHKQRPSAQQSHRLDLLKDKPSV